MRYFTLKEFDSPDEKGSGAKMDEQFLLRLEAARHLAGTPFVINSGYRTPAHNKKVGGKPNSSHLKGVACDIKVTSSANRLKIMEALILLDFKRIGVASGFIHVDCDNEKPNALWTY